MPLRVAQLPGDALALDPHENGPAWAAQGSEPQAAELPTRPPRRASLLGAEWVTGSATLVVFLVIVVGIYGVWLGPLFLNTQSRMFDVYQNVPPMLLSLGILICLACGQFDLSAGTMATLGTFLTVGLVVNQGLTLPEAIAVVLAVGVLGGLVNGFLVVRLHVNAFIATLGTGGVFGGLYTLYSNGQTISFSTSKHSMAVSAWFTGLNSFGSFQLKPPLVLVWMTLAILFWGLFAVVRSRARGSSRSRLYVGAVLVAEVLAAIALFVFGVPAEVNWTVLLLLVVAVAVWVLLRYTATGRHIYAIGGNPTAARLAGVRVDRLQYLAFVLSALFAAASGVVLAADQGTAVPGIADGFLLPAYAAAFLSTVILSSGRFHVWGTLIGGMAVIYIAQGIVTGGVSFVWTDVINGLVLIIAVALSTTLRRRATT